VLLLRAAGLACDPPPREQRPEEGEARVKAAYGTNYKRLSILKKKYDPENLFRVNQNIHPAA
jgi:hypothetical protein